MFLLLRVTGPRFKLTKNSPFNVVNKNITTYQLSELASIGVDFSIKLLLQQHMCSHYTVTTLSRKYYHESDSFNNNLKYVHIWWRLYSYWFVWTHFLVKIRDRGYEFKSWRRFILALKELDFFLLLLKQICRFGGTITENGVHLPTIQSTLISHAHCAWFVDNTTIRSCYR